MIPTLKLKILTFLFFLLSFLSLLKAQPEYNWAKATGSSGLDIGQSITIDSFGNVYTVGYFSGTADFDPGPAVFNLSSAGNTDIYIKKSDSSGNFLWAKRMGGSGADYGISGVIDSAGNIYTTGWFQATADFDPSAGTYNLSPGGTGDVFVSKLNSNGDFVWAKKIGGSATGLPDRGQDIALGASGNLYLTGMFIGTADFDPGPGVFNITTIGNADIFVTKLDTNGNFVWAKNMGGTSFNSGHSIALDAQENVYTTGNYGGTVDLDPGIGVTNFSTNSSESVFISKLDSNGNFIWGKAMNGNGSGESIKVGANRNLYFMGTFSGTYDFNPGPGTHNLTGSQAVFVVKLDANGDFVWAKTVGGASQDAGNAMTIDPIGNVYTTGFFRMTADFDPGSGIANLSSIANRDIFINKLDSSGNFVWAGKMGGNGSDVGNAITTDIFGNIYTTGSFQNTADFNPRAGIATLPSSGSSDIFVQRLNVERVSGRVFLDYNQNCQQEYNEGGVLRNLTIQPGNIVVQTDSIGMWYIDTLPAGNYTITIDTTGNWLATCSAIQNFTVVHADSLTLAPPFGLIATDSCTGPDISIFAPALRPGFSNQKIYIQACNRPFGINTLDSAYVIVELDPLLTIQTSSFPYIGLGNNSYRVNIDSIAPGNCINFTLDCHLSDSAILGQTLCMKATLLPLDSCTLDTIPTPYGPGNVNSCLLPWDGSSLEVSGDCVNDSIKFIIRNKSPLGIGDMNCFAPVRIYIDGQWLIQDSIQLTGGDSSIFMFSGDARTWRLEVDQHPLHPGNSRPNATVENCGIGTWTPNLVNILPHDDADKHIDIYCGLVTGSFDPNDKTGYPLGVNNTNDILPNQELEYTIRFQNTGTDTAFTVIIRDTLSTDLDILSVNAGVSSHHYNFRMYGPRILEWTFNSIMLPDSSTNESNSHGFVKFTVKQNSNLPIGTIIQNSASIYFDFNAPIFTNETMHTIAVPQNISWDGQDTITANICGDFVFNGFNYRNANSGSYWQAINNNGVDSLYLLHLTSSNTTSILNISTCDTLDFHGQTYTTSGQYTSIIPNTIGCDSIITLNLTVEKTFQTINEISCYTYTAPDSQIYTASGQYDVIIPNTAGCDSVITINLTIINNTRIIDTTICSSYTAPDGQIYTSPGQYTAVTSNPAGCDSIFIINLTTLHPIVILNDTTCANYYVAPDGVILFTTSQHTAIIPSHIGCDSIINLNVVFNQASSSTINETSCNSYTAPDGQIYTSPGQYTATIQNEVGCDSTITINLNIDTLTDSSINQNGFTLTANATGLSYQWLDCNNGNSPIIGATNQSYTAISNGDYAVNIINGTCSLTSNCVNITGVFTSTLDNDMGIYVYPTPVTRILHLSQSSNNKINIDIVDNLGRVLYSKTSKDYVTKIDLSNIPAGVYYLTINNGEKNLTQKIVVQ